MQPRTRTDTWICSCRRCVGANAGLAFEVESRGKVSCLLSSRLPSIQRYVPLHLLNTSHMTILLQHTSSDPLPYAACLQSHLARWTLAAPRKPSKHLVDSLCLAIYSVNS